MLGSLGLISLGFAVGAWSGATWTDMWRPFSHPETSVRCVERDACVGDTVDAFLMHYDDDKGGLTTAICGLTDADREAERSAAVLFLRDIVQGRTCQSANYFLEFRNPSARTLVSIESGTVTKIRQGPLHAIDF